MPPGRNPLADVRGRLFDVQAEFEMGASGRVVFQVHGISVAYDAATQTLSCSGQSAGLAPVNGRVKLQLLIDRTSLEIFAQDGLLAMTFCFLPATEDASLAIFSEGATAQIVSLDVFEMKSIWGEGGARGGEAHTGKR